MSGVLRWMARSVRMLTTEPEKLTHIHQVEQSRIPGTIWHAVLTASLPALRHLLQADPLCIHARGPVGETPLHMCFIYGSAEHMALAQFIMDSNPHTVRAAYIGSEYTGENILHIAIIKRNRTGVAALITRERKLLQARATGSFFAQGSACYYGEWPLLFAACTNQPEMVRLLLDEGADLMATDSNGNNIFHMVVIHNLPKMYTHIRQQYDARFPYTQSRSLCTQRNADGLTPFTLSAKLGVLSMFAFLLEETKVTEWTYGPVSSFLYPLKELDSELEPPSSPSSSSSSTAASPSVHAPCAMSLIMTSAHYPLLMHPHVLSFLDAKWRNFARRIFWRRMGFILAYLVAFMMQLMAEQAATACGKAQANSSQHISHTEGLNLSTASTSFFAHLLPPTDFSLTRCYLFVSYPLPLYIGRMLILTGACLKFGKECAELVRSGARQYLFQSSGSALLENCLSVMHCLCIFGAAAMKLSGVALVYLPVLLALASLSGWFYMFFFLLAFRFTGPLVIMVHRMMSRDVLRFLLVYLVFQAGFAQAFYVLFQFIGAEGYLYSVQLCFVALLGDFELDAFRDTPYKAVSVGLLVLYVVTITILLLNLLIAMMGDTYEKMNAGALEQWHLERCRIIWSIESELSIADRTKPINKYWIDVCVNAGSGAGGGSANSGGSNQTQRFMRVQHVNAHHYPTEEDEEKELTRKPSKRPTNSAAAS